VQSLFFEDRDLAAVVGDHFRVVLAFISAERKTRKNLPLERRPSLRARRRPRLFRRPAADPESKSAEPAEDGEFSVSLR